MQHVDLTITGRKCRIHRKGHSITSLENEGANLIKLQHGTHDDDCWSGGEQRASYTKSTSIILVNRYDARTLLDEMSLRQLSARNDMYAKSDANSSNYHCALPLIDEDGSAEDVHVRNYERFGTLEEYASVFVNATSTDKVMDGGSMVDSHRHQPPRTDVHSEGKDQQPFELGDEHFKSVPSGITLPKSMQQNNIIEHTASRVAMNNQLEVFLKVKQTNDANFSFLNPTDQLHGYYLYVRGKYSRNNNATDQSNVTTTHGGDDGCNPLSGLLGGYSSSSEEEEESNSHKKYSDKNSNDCNDSKDVVTMDRQHPAKRNNELLTTVEQQKQKLKADRLERLQLWKESRSIV